MDDSDFWENFLDTIWERKPAHLGSVVEPLLSSDELFTLSVVVAESLAAGNDSLRVRWCDDGKRTRNLAPNPESAEFLPRRSDRTLEGYSERMSSYETFFFQIPTLQLFHQELWPRVVRFCRKFYPRTGVPAHMAWTDAYVGRYQSTPFGVHVDGASNFTFGVNGRKTIYLWEPEFYHAHMARAGGHRYEEFVPHAIELTVGPGELIYWPSRFYHVAVPDNRFSVTMNFAFYPETRHSAWIERAFRHALADTQTVQTPLHGIHIPDGLAAACESAVQKVLNHSLERQLMKAVVAHSTGLGFLDPPPLRAPTTFESGSSVFRSPDAELACTPDGHGTLLVSANGYVVELQEEPSIINVLETLKSGRRVDVQPEHRILFERLYRWGAVERHWGEENYGGTQAGAETAP